MFFKCKVFYRFFKSNFELLFFILVFLAFFVVCLIRYIVRDGVFGFLEMLMIFFRRGILRVTFLADILA